MSTVKSLYDLDIASNSLLNMSASPTRTFPCKKTRQLSNLYDEYRSKYQEYHAEKEQKLTETMMQLDYVINSAIAFNNLLDRKDE